MKNLMKKIFWVSLFGVTAAYLPEFTIKTFTGVEGRLNNNFILWFGPISLIILSRLFNKAKDEASSRFGAYPLLDTLSWMCLAASVVAFIVYIVGTGFELCYFLLDGSVSILLKILSVILIILTIILITGRIDISFSNLKDYLPKNKEATNIKKLIQKLKTHEVGTYSLIHTIENYGVGSYEADLWVLIEALQVYDKASNDTRMKILLTVDKLNKAIENEYKSSIDEEVNALLENINLDK